MLPMLACRRERHQSCAAPRMACRCKCVWKRTNPTLDNMEAHGGFVSARVNGAKDTRFVKSPGIVACTQLMLSWATVDVQRHVGALAHLLHARIERVVARGAGVLEGVVDWRRHAAEVQC